MLDIRTKRDGKNKKKKQTRIRLLDESLTGRKTSICVLLLFAAVITYNIAKLNVGPAKLSTLSFSSTAIMTTTMTTSSSSTLTSTNGEIDILSNMYTGCNHWLLLMVGSHSSYEIFPEQGWCLVLRVAANSELFSSTSKFLRQGMTTEQRRTAKALPTMSQKLAYIYQQFAKAGLIDPFQLQDFQQRLWVRALVVPEVDTSPTSPTSSSLSSSSSTSLSLPIQVVPYQQLHGQPYATFPKYNLGSPISNGNSDGDGDDSGKNLLTTYQEFWEAHGNDNDQNDATNGTEIWLEWEKGNQRRKRPGTATIIKIIVMCKNEWPLIQDWVWYHGEIFGFDNLYVLDGTTPTDNNYGYIRPFLDQARDRYGVNVIFSPSSLMQLISEISDLAIALGPSSDFVMKMDPDEFLTFVSSSKECVTNSDQEDDQEDCTLSPYPLKDYLQSHEKNLGRIADGRKFEMRYSQRSVQDKLLCDNNRTNEIESYKLEPVVDEFYDDGRSKTYYLLANMGRHMFKSIHDSRTVKSVDLGGHIGSTYPPFTNTDRSQTENDVKIGLLHFHARCLETEVANCRKTLLSQGTIRSEDSNEEIIHKLTVSGRSRPLNPCGTLGFKKNIPSYHKALFLAKFLKNCTEATQEGFYPDAEVSKEIRLNSDFRNFLIATRAKYNSTW